MKPGQSGPHNVIELLWTIRNCYRKFMCFINIYDDLDACVAICETTKLLHSCKQIRECCAKPGFQLLIGKVTLVGYK